MKSAWIRAEDPLVREHPELFAGLPCTSSGSDRAQRSLLQRFFGGLDGDCLRRVPGRETLRVPPAGGADRALVVKRFQGDLWRDWWYERLHRSPARSPARRECENLIGLAECGLPVPRALAWAEEPRALAPPLCADPGRGGRSAMAMQHVAHGETLRQRLGSAPPAERRGFAAELARLIGRLHESGWYHRDLYLEHLLVVADRTPGDELGGRLVLIDCGRARRAAPVPRRWIVKDLAALLHSTPAGVGTLERLRFFVGYLRASGIQAERRAFARAVLVKARRIAAHTPRFEYRAASTS